MKKVIIAILFLTAATFAGAQGRNNLKGPAAKNYKPWKDDVKTEQTIVMKSDNAKKLQGPAAKNNKVWAEENKEDFTEIAVVSDRPALKGPAAKNHKVWMKADTDNSTLVKKDTIKRTK
ncbi:hypothetical protein [Reichenbachiella ulvae]|uniref:Uncharacterized protein n=1 Tax=Reichenbachiella ulvae TaxID=2980104 RepID=A0ABT3CRA8_9BACT|nr:hypothetical protein [Reichenbachiella ulvae]MCV9386025.1 hypothetical protein [Reichenbachiella ulvae]